MNKTEFINQMQNKFPWLDDHFFQQIEKYRNFLQIENQKTNLTNLAADDQIYGTYFWTSVFLYDHVWSADFSGSLLDIGSGSGIPGIVLKLIFPNLKLTIIDSNGKKIRFLQTLMQLLQLSDVQIICGRAEEYAQKMNEQFDYVTSRAVADLRKILELSIRFCRVGGKILQPKSRLWEAELQESVATMQRLNIQFLEKNEAVFVEHYHCLLIFVKTAPTPPGFPREWREILKKPLVTE